MLLKRLAVLVAAVFAAALCGCQSSEIQNESKETLTAPAVTGKLSFSVLKVGKADAIIMQTENYSIIIDCGEKDDGSEIIEFLSDNNIERIDYLFITHFDKDHVGGAAKVINNIEIDQIITPDYEGSNDEYENYINAVTENGITPINLTENMTFILDDVLFEVYPPQRKSYTESDNDFSLAISVIHGANSFLFTGDAEEVRLSEILSQTGTKYDFLKVPHHGKYNNFTKQFIESINPLYSVITCSDKNPADEQTVNVLEAAGSKIYYTKDGDITVSCSGTEIIITQ